MANGNHILTFTNPAFQRCDDDDRLPNQGMHGWSLMQFLLGGLADHGYTVDRSNAPTPEDFGWYVDFAVGDTTAQIVIYSDDDDPEHAVSVDVRKKKSFLRRGGNDEAESLRQALFTAVRRVVDSHPQTVGLRESDSR